MAIHKVIEVMSQSAKSWEDAAESKRHWPSFAFASTPCRIGVSHSVSSPRAEPQYTGRRPHA